MNASNAAIEAIAAKAAQMNDEGLVMAAAEANKQLHAAKDVDQRRNLNLVLIGLAHAADARWIDPQSYSEALEVRIDAGMDEGLSYPEALYAAVN